MHRAYAAAGLKKPLAYTDAQEECNKALGNLGSLVKEEQEKFVVNNLWRVLTNTTRPKTAYKVWIGLTNIYDDNGKKVQWIDKSFWEYTNWGGDHNVNGNTCFALSMAGTTSPSSWSWVKESCSKTFPYLCQMTKHAIYHALPPPPAHHHHQDNHANTGNQNNAHKGQQSHNNQGAG